MSVTSELIDEVMAFLRRFVVFSNEHDALKAALFVLHTWAIDRADVTAYLHISSAERECGKSTLLDLLELLVRQPWLVVSPSEAVVYRKISQDCPTLLLDEIDTIFTKNRDPKSDGLRALLNAGFERGRVVPRCVGPSQALVNFDVFSAKVLAGIGEIDDTVASRCIRIRLERKRKTDVVERKRRRVIRLEVDELRERLEAWSEEEASILDNFEPLLPESLGDREADIWEPLLAIADIASDEIGARARRAAVDRSSTVKADETTGVRLLAAMRAVFGDRHALWTKHLVSALNDDPESAWGGWNHGEGIKDRHVAKLLEPYGIKSRTVRIGTESAKGWLREMLEPVWERYVTDDVTDDLAPSDGCDDVTANPGYGKGEAS